MRIRKFPAERNGEVRNLILDILAEEGFEYDPEKDSDLDDIRDYYLKRGGMFFIGMSNDEVIGTGAVCRINSEKCEIRRIYVKKEFRGKGYGRKLFLQALDFAIRHYPVVTLKTDRSLDKAVSMYLESGFSVMKKEDNTLFFSYTG